MQPNMRPTKTRNRAVSDASSKSVTWALELPTPDGMKPGNSKTHRRTPSPYPGAPSALPVPPVPARDGDRCSFRLPIRSPDSGDDDAECYADAEDNDVHRDPVIDDHLPHLRLPPPDSGYFNAQSHIDPANAYYTYKFSEEEHASIPESESDSCPSLETCSEQTEDSDPTPYSSLGSTAGTFSKYVSTPLLHRRRSLKDKKQQAQAQQKRVIEWVESDAEEEEELKQKARDELNNYDRRSNPVQQPAEVPWHKDWLPSDPSYLASITHFPDINGKRIPIFTWGKVIEIPPAGSPRTVFSSVHPPEGVTAGSENSGLLPSHTPDELDEADSKLFWSQYASRPVDPVDLAKRLKPLARTVDADREQHEELEEMLGLMPDELFYSATEDSGADGTTHHIEYADTAFRTRDVVKPAEPESKPRDLRDEWLTLPPPALPVDSWRPAVPIATAVTREEILESERQGQMSWLPVACNPWPRTPDMSPSLLLEGSPSFEELALRTQEMDKRFYRRHFGVKL